MRPQFRESKVSVIIIGLILAAAAVTFGLTLLLVSKTAALFVLFPWLFVALGFFSLTVSIEQDVLYVIYGLGITHREIPLADIQKQEVVANNYMTWLYDPKRENVLRLQLRDGRRVVIGIGEPRQIMNIISSRIRG